METQITTTSMNRVERLGAHSHIRGLGLNSVLDPQIRADGMVGQLKARRGAGVIVKLIQDYKLAGRAILIAGAPGTGKTALAMAMAQSIGSETPFVAISGSEIYSLEMSKTEALTQAFRRSIAVKIKEVNEIIQGEVVDIKIDHTSSSSTSTPKSASIILKTTDMEASYDIGERMLEWLRKERIIPGDVISFNKVSGHATKLGRSYARSYDYDAVSGMTRFVQCPTGELQSLQEHVHTVSLHEIDVINSRSQGFLALFTGETGEISNDVRDQIDSRVAQWKLSGKCEIIPGVLFIDECHMLDIECFSFINRALETDLAPIVIFATNRGNSIVRGTTDMVSPHGLPYDLLDRLLIIHTNPYTEEEVFQILSIRAQEEEINIDPEALQLLATTATQTASLRYSLNLLSTSLLIAKKRSSPQVQSQDVQRAYNLFADSQRSADFLEIHSSLDCGIHDYSNEKKNVNFFNSDEMDNDDDNDDINGLENDKDIDAKTFLQSGKAGLTKNDPKDGKQGQDPISRQNRIRDVALLPDNPLSMDELAIESNLANVIARNDHHHGGDLSTSHTTGGGH
jgi:RuvB-like protein 2